MIKYYFNGGPNPRKTSLFLEEAGLDYEPIFVDTSMGEQLNREFSTLNPNCKVPVIVDANDVVFDSNAILLYLGEKHQLFVPPPGSAAWAQMLSWLMFVASGVGPYSGQAVHFRHAAPEEIPYALSRFAFEARRHFQVVEDRLAGRPYLLGESYSIVDMALWGWGSFLPRVLGEEAAKQFPRLQDLIDRISERPAAARVLARTMPMHGPPPTHENPHLFRYLGNQAT